VVLDAEPGARVFRGFAGGVTREDFERALDAGTVIDLLQAIDVRRGDCIYLPSGICHALGAGVVVAEVQTPSDTTFRVWDWNRHDPSRPLHLDDARECLRFGAAQEDGLPGVTRGEAAPRLEASGLRQPPAFGRPSSASNGSRRRAIPRIPSSRPALRRSGCTSRAPPNGGRPPAS
jgi:hypothetical protein